MKRTQIIQGDRVGKLGKLRVGCSAAIFDETKHKILLTRRSDNGLWCLPSGGMDPGESAEEACVREVKEETGLDVKIERLIGIYTSPDYLIEYPDGNRVQIVAIHFEAQVIEGKLGMSNETTDYGYFSIEEINALEIMSNHSQRIQDAFQHPKAVLIR